MADLKISQLTAISVLTPATDVLPVVDVGGVTKKITTNQILGSSGVALLASATITGDLTVDTSTLKVDSTNNRVGIGTPTPGETLDISAAAPRIRQTATTGTNGSLLALVNTGGTAYLGLDSSGAGLTAAYALNLYHSGAYPIVFSTTATERYRIDSTGISTWSVAGTTAMTLNSTGLGIGGSPNTGFLTVGAITNASATTNAVSILSTRATCIITANGATDAAGTTINYAWINGGQGPLIFRNAAIANVMTLDSSGNVGIGVTPSAWATYKAVSVGGIGASVFGLGSSQAGVAQGAFFNNGAGSGWAYSATSQVPTYYLQINGENIWNIAASGTAGAQITAWTPAMKLDASGNLILLSPSTPPTLATNGQLTVNATSNTNLRFSYRGSDGTTRVANLTLA